MNKLRAIAGLVLVPLLVVGLGVMMAGALLCGVWTRAALSRKTRLALRETRAVKELLAVREMRND